jgi:hypothetical protein
MRIVRAQRAFVLAGLGREEAEVARMVETARPTVPDELIHLAVGWDKMRAFLARHGLI